jgi:uncharacterized membrane protein
MELSYSYPNTGITELSLMEIDCVSGAWSWSDFAGSTIVGAVGGAAIGAIGGSFAAGAGALPGAGIGAATGAVGGAVAYAGNEAWHAVFG